MKFNLSDEATLADWKGWDLSQTKSIPDIDILLLAVRKVNILHLNSRNSGSYIQSSPSNLKQFIRSRVLYIRFIHFCKVNRGQHSIRPGKILFVAREIGHLMI